MPVLAIVVLMVLILFFARVALFRRARIVGGRRPLVGGPLAPARRIARRRRFWR